MVVCTFIFTFAGEASGRSGGSGAIFICRSRGDGGAAIEVVGSRSSGVALSRRMPSGKTHKQNQKVNDPDHDE
jgi:hypothetical protein